MYLFIHYMIFHVAAAHMVAAEWLTTKHAAPMNFHNSIDL